MKSWVYVALLIFIAVAGYQFGHYQNMLATSDKAKAQLFKDVQNEPLKPAVEVKTPAARPTVKMVDEPLGQTLRRWENSRDALAQVNSVADDAPLRISATEQKLKQYFTLHPDAETLLLHSVRCELKGCELTGQFEGSGEELQKLVEPLKQTYTSASNSMSTQDNITHFVLQIGTSI